MTPILAQRGHQTAENKSRWWNLGATWMQEFTKTLSDAEREALAQALASLLERSQLAECRPEEAIR